MTLESNKILGGVGALLMVISPFSIFAVDAFSSVLGLVGIILVLIAMKGLADHYNEGGIFNNALYGVILTIVGGVVFVVTMVVGAVGLLSELGLDLTTLSTDPAALSAMDWEELVNLDFIMDFNFEVIMEYIVVLLAGLVVLFIFMVIAAIFYRKSLITLSEKTGVGLFGTAGLILLIGAVLTIIGIGFLLLWVALILLTVAFFSIRAEPAEPPPTTPS